MMRAILLSVIAAFLPCSAATRFYLPSTGTAAVSPAFTHQASWTAVDNVDRIRCVTTKISSAMTSKTEGKATTVDTQLVRQYVSDPIDAQTITAGTVKGSIRTLESGTNDNLDNVVVKIIVVSRDGTSLTGTILNLGQYVAVNEFPVAATGLTSRRIADGDTTTQVVANQGDRIVIELGFRNSTTGTSVSGDLNFGDNAASDLGDNETDTAANNPFVELSNTITFEAVAVPRRRPLIFQ